MEENKENKFTIQGTYLGSTPVKIINNKNYRSFYLEITENPKYPNTPEFNVMGIVCDQLDMIEKGNQVEVSFNLNGKRYQKQSTGTEAIFTNLRAWRIKVIT